MGESCAITSVCSLAQEAKQYVKDQATIDKLVLLGKDSRFREAVRLAKESGKSDIILSTHKDGQPTFQTIMMFLKVEQSLGDYSSLSQSEKDEFEKILQKDNLLSTMLYNKLSPIANNYNPNHTKNNKEGDISVGELTYEQAVNIATVFNLQNAVKDRYIAVVDAKKNWVGVPKEGKYKVRLVENTKENRQKLMDDVPKFAAIQAAIDFFKDVGIEVNFDQMNPKYAASEMHLDTFSVDEVGDVVKTLITISTNGSEDFQGDIPGVISRNIAVAAARVLIQTIEKNPNFRESIGYNRLKAAIARYKNTINDKLLDEDKLMEGLITDEIEYRINQNINERFGYEKSKDRMYNHVLQRVKWVFRNIVDFVNNALREGGLKGRWKSEKYQKKRITVRHLQERASKAVTEMLADKESIKATMTHKETNAPLEKRHNLKRFRTQQLKDAKTRHSKAQKAVMDIEEKLKTHILMLNDKQHTKTLTRFENMINTLEEAFVSTNEVGSVTSQANTVSRAVTQVVFQLNTELQELENDIHAVSLKINAMVPDYNNEQYMDQVNKIQQLYSRFQTLCDIQVSINDNLGNGVLNPEVSRLGPNGVERSNLRSVVQEMEKIIEPIRTSFETTIDEINLDLLEQIIGTKDLNVIAGKMFPWTKRAQAASDFNKTLKAAKKDNPRYMETRNILAKHLKDPSQLRNSLWHRAFGSPQNSASLLNQVAFLAIHRATTTAHNKTQQSLISILEGRRLYKNVTQKNIIEKDDNGVPTGNLIRPIDYARYERELENMERIWGEEFIEKYKNKDLTHDQRAILWKGFRQERFNEWNKIPNENTGKTDFRYKKQRVEVVNPRTGELTPVEIYAPNKDIYVNEKWFDKDNGLSQQEKELSNWFFSIKYFSDEKLDGQGSGCHKIPMFKGGMFDTFWGSNITHLSTLSRNTLKKSFLQDLEDQDFGAAKAYTPLSQKDWSKTDDDINDKVKRIPLYGIRKLDDMKGLSTDLYSSYLAYEDMSNNYQAKSRVETLLSNIGTQTYRNIEKNDPKNIKVKSTWRQGYTFREEFENIIDKELYGLKKDDIVFSDFRIRAAKIMNWLGRIVTTLFLGGNIHSSFVNLVTGYNEIIKEAGVGEYINKRDIILAMRNYTHHVQWKKLYLCGNTNWLGVDTGQGNENAHGFLPYLLRQPSESPNLVNQILRDFDFTERYVQDIRNYSSKNANKIARNFSVQRVLMLPYEVTDHWMQAVPLMALLHHEKVYSRPDAKGEHREISLMQALYPEYSRWGKEDRYERVPKLDAEGKVLKDVNGNTIYEVELDENGNTKVDKKGKPIYKVRRKRVGKYGLVEKPSFIDTGNKYGIFYKTLKDAQDGEDLLKLIEIINANIYNFYHTADYELQNLASESPLYNQLLEEYKITKLESIKDFENAKASLIKSFEKLTYNNAELSKFTIKAREIVNRMHGVYDGRSKGMFNRTLLGATMLSMKNYAVGLVNKRFMQGHYNIVLNKWDEGTLITVAKVMVDAFVQGLGEYKFIGGLKNVIALVTPFMFSRNNKMLKWFNLNRHLQKRGFTEAQISNLKRAKIDALRILFWGILNTIVYGLGSGWIGGWDDDDDLEAIQNGDLTLFEQMLGMHVEGKHITRKSIEDGSAFEKDGALYSDVTLRQYFEDIGIDMNDIENHPERIPHNNSEELQFIKEYIIPNLDLVFAGYGDTGGMNPQIDKWYTEWCDKNNYYKIDKNGTKKRGWGRGKGHSIFPNAFEATLKGYGEGGTHIPKTTMQNIKSLATEKKKELDRLMDTYESIETPSNIRKIGKLFGFDYSAEQKAAIEKKDELMKQIKQVKKTLTTIDYINNGYNVHISTLHLKDMQKARDEFFREYNVNSIRELKAKQLPMSDNEDVVAAKKQLQAFLDDYESTEKKLERSQKELRNKTFQKDYFKNEHPNLYYLLGVVNYVAERALIEQESFIPFADLLARKGGDAVVNFAFEKPQEGKTIFSGLRNWQFYDDIIHTLPGLANYEPVDQPYKWNAFNEAANLISLPAATGAITSWSNTFSEFLNWIFTSDSGYRNQIQQLEAAKELALKSDNQNEADQIQYEIDRIERDWEKHHAQNNSARLRKGEHKIGKGQSFIPYWRTPYMMGLFNFLDYGDPEGGWKATQSFKSFYYKEDK